MCGPLVPRAVHPIVAAAAVVVQWSVCHVAVPFKQAMVVSTLCVCVLIAVQECQAITIIRKSIVLFVLRRVCDGGGGEGERERERVRERERPGRNDMGLRGEL